MEHLERFGLSQDPFRSEPQLDFYFESAAHAEAKQRLLRCLRQGKELCVLVGEVGTGTTTLVRALLEELDPERFEVAVLVVARGVEPGWLRATVARQLGIESPAPDRAEGMRQLYARLVELREAGRRAVVAIDEAQALAGSEALAELASWLQFEHDESRLLSALLVGTPELERALAHDASLGGRVDLRVGLGRFGGPEARAYLAHRIRVAGGEPAILAPAVMDAIAERGSGIPRRMNALADGTLFEAHLAGRAKPTPADVERAARDLPWTPPAGDPMSGLPAAGAAASAPAAEDDDGLRPAFDPDEDTLQRRARGDGLERDATQGFGLDEIEVADLEADLASSVADDVERALEPQRPMPAARRAAPEPSGRPELERTVRADDVDLEVEAQATGPGPWRTAAPVKANDKPPLPEEDEIDGLFVDLVEEA